MKKIYSRSIIHHWFQLMWMVCLALPLKAQLSTPPVIQGQQVIEGGIDFSSRARLAKTSTGDYGVLNGTGLSYLNSSGILKSVAAIEGSIQTGTSPVEYTKVLSTAGLVPATDGGVIVLASDATNLYVIKKDANQNRVWSTILAPLANQANTESYGSGTALLPTTDGNYIAFAGHGLTGFVSNVTAFKFNSSGTILWSRDVFTPQTSPTGGGCPNFQGYNKVAASPDGSFLLTGGQFCQFTRPNPNQAIAAKIDGEAHPVWTRTYSSFVAFSDQIANPYEAGTFLVLTTTDPNFNGSFNGPTYPGKLQADGTVVGLGNYAAVGGSTIASDGSGQPYFVIQEPSPQNGGDFKLTGLNQAYAPVWTKTLGGSSSDVPQAILATGDGYMVAGTTTSTDGDVKGKQGNALATWAVKLTKTATPLVMTAPTYNCQTGAITFNTTGGDGSTITYIAPGVTRASATDNFGTVEAGLRSDPKFIAITAIQNGISVTYNFDLKAACSSTPPTPPTPLPPVSQPIPDQFLTVGQSFPGTGFVVGSYFSDPNLGVIPNYVPGWSFTITGLPDGLSVFSRVQDLLYTPAVLIVGTPTTAGVYTVTVRASTEAFRNNPIVTTFKITVSPTAPPAGGTFALIAPDYNCSTGAITFKTTGGNGSLIEYQAAGITGWTTNPNQFVDKDSRTANDVKPFTLMARQNGQVVTYVWDLKAACGRARAGLEEPNAGLQVRVLGNPVVGQTAEVEIAGVSGERVQLNLVDSQGRALYQHTIGQAGVLDQVSIPLGQRSGLLLLQVHTARERQTVKLLKE